MGITWAAEKNGEPFGLLANKVCLAFEDIKPYLDPVTYKIGAVKRRYIIKVFALNDVDEIERLKKNALNFKKKPTLKELGFSDNVINEVTKIMENN